MTQDTGHMEILAKSQALYKHDLDTWKFSDFIKGLGLSQISKCPVSWPKLGHPVVATPRLFSLRFEVLDWKYMQVEISN